MSFFDNIFNNNNKNQNQNVNEKTEEASVQQQRTEKVNQFTEVNQNMVENCSNFESAESVVCKENNSESTQDEVPVNLFGEPIVDEAKKPKEISSVAAAQKGKKSISTPTPTRRSKIDPNYKVTGDWRIHYATMNFLVSELFEEGEIPEEGVTLEQIRQKLEMDYREFGKERTNWDIDKEERILIPWINGSEKGGRL